MGFVCVEDALPLIHCFDVMFFKSSDLWSKRSDGMNEPMGQNDVSDVWRYAQRCVYVT